MSRDQTSARARVDSHVPHATFLETLLELDAETVVALACFFHIIDRQSNVSETFVLVLVAALVTFEVRVGVLGAFVPAIRSLDRVQNVRQTAA